jgi:hypothetical protein
MNEEINEVENFTAKDFRKMIKGGDEVQNNIIMNKCLMDKIISDIRFEIAVCSLAGLSSSNVSIPFSIIPVPKEYLGRVMNDIKNYFESHKFEVSVAENMISLDWSEEGPYADINDDYDDHRFDDIEQYENMHRQKSKKQHAPKQHNFLKVVKGKK